MSRYVAKGFDLTSLRETHIKQLEWYIEVVSREGLYYGNKGQFIKRESEIKELIKELEDGFK